jgi:hypothetical protein
MFDGQTEKLEAKAQFTLIAHHRRGPHWRGHVRKKKLDADGLAREEL